MRAAKPLSLALLLCMLLGLAAARARLEFGLGPSAHDADYYFTIARNVAEGHGLRTNLSLYLQGFQSFPHRVTTSPVWPLALGLAGRGMPLPLAAKALPTALFFVDLVLLYFLALGCTAGLLLVVPVYSFARIESPTSGTWLSQRWARTRSSSASARFPTTIR